MSGLLYIKMAVPTAIIVEAGQNRTMCLTQNLLITDLQATITGDVNNGDWLTYGDGRFQPGNLLTVRFNVAQTNQITYVPGPNDKALGYYRLLLMSDAPVNNPQERVTDEVRINFQMAPPLFCSNNINISLNESCRQKVDATMLQPNPVQPYSNYIITLYDPSGNIIPDNILTKDHIDKEITFKLGHQCTSNICWGKFKVEDYFPPVFICKNDTITCTRSFSPDSLGFPIPTGAYIDTIINKKYIVKNWDACSDVTLEYTDVVTKAECARDEDKTITRKWKAYDIKGNTSFCTELIVVKRISLAQVIFPPNYEGHDRPAFECGDNFPALLNGHPSPDTTGSPIIGHCGNLQSSYTDVPFALCGKSFKIARSWFVIDWCTAESVTKNQIISVKDSQSPTIVCSDTIILAAGAYQCNATKTLVSAPLSITDCSDFTISHALFLPNGTSASQYLSTNQTNTYIEGLPVGEYYIQYIVTDVCQNQTICESTVIVEDTSPPYPACDGLTKVALDANGKGRIFATTFDDGSTDNCGIASFKARKMTDLCGFGLAYGDYVDFCCAELGQTIMVALEVTDHYGNKNTCMVEVKVEDKLKPTLNCPPDITLACTDNYDFTQLDIYGTVVTEPNKVKDIIIQNDYHSGKVGTDGLAKDNCTVTVASSYKTDINCHTGFIYRTFVATDANGLKDSCTQKITILNPDPFDSFDIKWPNNYSADGCKLSQTSPDVTGKPIFSNTQCGQISATYDDTPFFAADSACLKIFRVWTVIDWCQFNQSPTTGKWGPHTQIIKLHNTDKPVYTSTCIDTIFCAYDHLCQKGNVTLSASAEDPCTEVENLVWQYSIDLQADGTVDTSGQTNLFVGDLPLGTHTITWTVTDLCGNSEKCTRTFKIEDCKKPTPYCISSLTFTLDEYNGNAEIWAKDFDNGSYDNCTDTSELIFTFDGATPVKTLLNQVHYFKGNGIQSTLQEYEDGYAQKWIPTTLSSGKYFDCGDIQNGIADTLILDMTVTDHIGNQDYCEVKLIIQDNHAHCDDVITVASIAGTVKTEYHQIPQATKIKYEATEITDSVEINNSNGKYIINQLPLSKAYKIAPKLNTDPMQGITTLDLVIIQRHILGLKILDSPYKLIAADVNGSKLISAGDLVDLRKLILGLVNKFPKSVPSWVFVPKEGGFSDPKFPFNYTDYIITDNLTQDQDSLDFVAVKIGDVNESAFDFKGSSTEKRNNHHSQPFDLLTSIENLDGSDYLVFRSSENIEIDGMQAFVNMENNDAFDTNHNVTMDHNMESAINFHNDGVNFLLYQSLPTRIENGEILYSIKLAQKLHTNEIMLDHNKQSEIYINGESRPLQLKQEKNHWQTNKITLVTNPVVDELHLLLDGSSAQSSLKYTIMNAEGKILTTSSLEVHKDISEYSIKLNEDSPAGIYFLHISIDEMNQTLKFIRIR
jgi:hypothetical protein